MQCKTTDKAREVYYLIVDLIPLATWLFFYTENNRASLNLTQFQSIIRFLKELNI